MATAKTTFAYDEVKNPAMAEAMQQTAQQIEDHLKLSRQTIRGALALGAKLAAHKKELGHGLWARWLDEKTALGVRTAQRYMKAASAYPPDKYDTVSSLALITLCALQGDEHTDLRTKVLGLLEQGTPAKTIERIIKDAKVPADKAEKPGGGQEAASAASEAKGKAGAAEPIADVARRLAEQYGDDLPALIEALKAQLFKKPDEAANDPVHDQSCRSVENAA